MGEISLWQASFNAGELTPLLEGREDIQKYPNGCRRLRNYHPLIQGPARRRAGTRYVAATKGNGNAWLVPFVRKRSLAYILEFGDNYIRFYRNRGQLLNSNTGGGLGDAFTKVLLHFEGADASTIFTDESGKVWTAAANAQIDTAQFKFGSAAGLFDGTGDEITTPDSVDFAFGSGDFTIDGWFFCNVGLVGSRSIIGQSDAGFTAANTSFVIRREPAGNVRLLVSNGSAITVVTGTTLFSDVLNPGWHHFAAVRTGNLLKLFIDGVQEGLSTAFTGSVNDVATALFIGSRTTGVDSWQGWLDEIRVTKGLARWTANFDPPTGGDGAPYEIVSPWTYAQLTDVDGTFKPRLVQSKDILYICQGTGIKQLNRFGDINWTITDFQLIGGPFDSENTSATTVYASAATGSVTLTASTAVFTSAHIGSLFKLKPQDLASVPPWEPHQGLTTNDLRRSDGKTYKMVTAGVSVANGQPVTGSVSLIHEDGTASDGSADSKALDPFDNTGQVRAGLDWTFQDPGYGVLLITAIGGGGTTATATVSQWRTGSNAQLPAAVVGAPNASKRWSFGLFSDANGWPIQPTFFRERFVLVGTSNIAFSTQNDFNDFSQETAGQVLADNGFIVSVSSDRAEDVLWASPTKRVLFVGTTGGEYAIQEQNINQAFGPGNRKIEPQTEFGSNGATPVKINGSPTHIEASGLRARSLEQGDFGDFTDNSLNDLAEHVLLSTCIQTSYAAQPDSFFWNLRADGRLACMTHSKPQDVFAWSHHFIGGFRDAARVESAKVRSIASIPAPDGTIDDTWCIAERTINGAVKRYIEFLTPAPRAPERHENESKEEFKRRVFDYQADLFFVDGGVTYDAPLTITNVTLVGGLLRITSAGHPLVNGDSVRVDGVMGPWKINALSFTAANVAANTFDLAESDASMFATYVSGGKARKLVTVISNLSPWEGETLQVLADGAVHPDRTVSGGAITLQVPSGRVQLGWKYLSIVETQRPAGGNERGSAQGQLGAINSLNIRFFESLGGSIGPNEETLDQIDFRTAADLMDLPPPLFSGDREQGWPDGFSTDRNVVFVQDQPLPSTIVGFGQNSEVNVS